MPWSHRTPNIQRYEVWVRDGTDGMVSDMSMVFKNKVEAEAYARKIDREFEGGYNTQIRPSSTPIPLGHDKISLRDAGVRYR